MSVKEEYRISAALPPDFEKLPIAERMAILKQLREKHDALQQQDNNLDLSSPSTYFVQN